METQSVVMGIAGSARAERAILPGDGEIATMGLEGDVKTVWNPRNTDEVEAARAQFRAMRAKRYLAFRCNQDGTQGEQISDFDPEAGKIILVPPMAGG